MDIDELKEYGFILLTATGCIGVGVIALSLSVSIIPLFGWTLKGNAFLLAISAGMWLSTFLIPGLSKIVLLKIRTKYYELQTKLYKGITHAIKTDNDTKLRLNELYLLIIYIVFYSTFIAFPIISVIIAFVYRLDIIDLSFLAYFRFYSLMVNVIFIIVIISKYIYSGLNYVRVLQLSFIVIALVSTFVLWFVPALHPYRLITYFVFSSDVALIGARLSQSP